MTRSTTRHLASPLLGALCLLGTALALPARAQPAAPNNSSCSLPATSRKEGMINLPVGEDEGFFGSKSIGQPAIAFVMDSSENMRKLILDVTDPAVIGNALVAGNPAGPTARGCVNTTLNALRYEANPCKDDHDNSLNGGGCNRGLPTKPLGGLYDPTYSYRAYGSNGTIFRDNEYYVHDLGWGASVDNPTSWGTGAAACTAAGVTDLLENPACATCLDSKGYYIPLNMNVFPFYQPEVPPRPVFKGRWLNFYPPRYLVARTVFLQLYGSFQTANIAHQSQFRTAGRAEGGQLSCFSRHLDAGFDGLQDGIYDMGPGSSTKYRGLCGGGPANSYWSQTYNVPNMFSGPTAPCPANLTGNYIPSDAPLGTTAIIFKQDADNQCHAYFSADGVTPTARAICAPYAEAILQAGATLAETPAIYNNYFTFQNPAPGAWNYYAPLSDQGICSPANSYPCAKGVVILVAGGKPSFDDNLPCEITGGLAGCPSLVSSATACGGSGPGPSANLPRTANFMANHNYMPSGGWDGGVNVQTYVVGFGSGDPTLLAAADEGKGKFISATSPDSLKAGILEAVRLASTAQITFSSAAFSAVQSQTSSQLLVPRFTPKINKSIWPGRLLAYRVVSEDACGCKAAGPLDPCDYNQDGFCGGVFFQDSAGSFIAANANGVFEKANLTAGKFVANGSPAVEYWEAGAKLTAKTSTNRRIFTVIDEDGSNNADGLFDYRDKVIEFNTANAARLAPYLISGPGDMCTRLGNRLSTCLDSVACATKIIEYVRGKDLFNEDCNNTTVDRAQMLGDIYHSAPIVVEPPMDSKNQICGLGLANQCLVSLYKTETLKVPTTAYDDYVGLNLRRDKIALVGSNDGIFHAFRTGVWAPCIAAGNPTGCVPSIGYYNNGDGDELWSFIPPDLLPKLERLIENERELYVDGTPMVRDIWADGSDGSSPDGKKEAGEFHTVAVVGERRGGTHFFALDVSNPSGPVPESTGFFRWMWPQPNTVADRMAGQSYNDYIPSAPPIGPVRLKNTLIAGLPTYFTDVDPPDTPLPPVPVEERWIVLLNGGYDAAKQRGHTVDMVDVWYGGQGVIGNNVNPRVAIWTFNPLTQIPSLTSSSAYSFAATPGMVGFGPKNTNVTYTQNKFFFDTATIGDLGGQLWTLRFNDPDPANWAGARAFRNDSTNSPNHCARQPFFALTSNVVASQGGHLRTMLGSGDRANLTDTGGGECSWDNLLACLRRGCDLDITYKLENACGTTSTFTRSWTAQQANNCNQGPEVETVNVPAAGADCCAPGGSNDLNGSFTVELTNCPSAPGIIKWTHQATCKAMAANTTMCSGTAPQTYVCDTVSKTPIAINTIWPGYNQSVANMPDNGFYSVKIFDPVAGRRNFNNPTVAKVYDGNALRQSDLVAVNPMTITGAATITQPGWAAKYVHGAPTHVSLYPPAFAGQGSDLNERTATGSTAVGGCVFWSTYIPANTTPACVPATNGLNTQYNLNFITGGKCTGLNASLAAGSYSSDVTTSPPVAPQLTEFLAPDGTMSITLVGVPRQQGGAASVTQIASSNELIRESYTLDVPRPEHSCRHAPGLTPAAQRLAAKTNCY